MYEYIDGTIVGIHNDFIILAANDIGYRINIKSKKIKMGDIKKVYIYQDIKEQSNLLYGFLDKKERFLFCELLKIRGIGIKISGNIINYYEYSDLENFILLENEDKLLRIPGVSKKTVKDIFSSTSFIDDSFREVYMVLLNLNIDKKIIDKYFQENNIKSKTNEQLIKDILKYIKKAC